MKKNLEERLPVGNPDNERRGTSVASISPKSASDPGPYNAMATSLAPSSEIPPSTDRGDVPNFWFPYSRSHKRMQEGGWARQITVKDFPIATTISGVNMRLIAGAIREMHWHPNADEWLYVISGQARMTLFAATGHARTMDFAAGDIAYIPQSMGHYVENIGDTDLRFLETFRSSYYASISLSDWMSHTPPELVQAHTRLSHESLSAIPKKQVVIMPE